MIKKGKNAKSDSASINGLLNKCKSILEKHHIPSIQKQIILAEKSRIDKFTDSSGEFEDRKKLIARLSVFTSIIENIDQNVSIVNSCPDNYEDDKKKITYSFSIGSECSIASMMQGQDQVFIDEANAEANHGIGNLARININKEEITKPKKRGFWGRLWD